MATRAVIAERLNVSRGNGLYDLRLVRDRGNALAIEVVQSFFFDFVANETNSSIKWSAAERAEFLEKWRAQIPATWNKPSHVTVKGHSVSIRFISNIRDAAAGTQWQVRVYKLKSATSRRQSSVWRDQFEGKYDAALDSNDWRIKKLHGQRSQTGLIHDFGHMIGNSDEYKKTSAHLEDRPSVMNSGDTVRDRHLAHFVAWARPHIEKLTGGSVMTEQDRDLPAFLVEGLRLSAEQEMDAVREWKEGLGPEDVVLWEVRWRGSHEPVPAEETDAGDFAKLEVVFEALGPSTGSWTWLPQSAEALDALAVGS